MGSDMLMLLSAVGGFVMGLVLGARRGKQVAFREAASFVQSVSNAYSVGSFIVDLDPETMMDDCAHSLRVRAGDVKHP